MLRLPCPHCGLRDQPEFTYGGDATTARPDTGGVVDDGAWVEYLFLRGNPDGLHREHWHHTHGCRLWLRVSRDTRTGVVAAVEPARCTPAHEDEA